MGDSGIGTTNPFVENGNGTEKCGRIQRITVCRFLHFVCQHVQQDFRVRTGIDVATVIFEHFAFQLLTIGQIAVMGECNAERGIDVKRLRFLLVLGGTGCRITDMADSAGSRESAHVTGTENVPDQTVRLEHGEFAVIAGCDTCSILTTMLQELQCIVNQLVDRGLGNDTNDATHGGLLNQKLRKTKTA